MAQKFADAARAYLSAGINDTDTTIVTVSNGDLFPVANTTDWFKATLQDETGIEVVYVNTHTASSTTFSGVVRGREGTTARAFAAGSVFGIRLTASDAASYTAGPASSTDGNIALFDGATGKLIKDSGVSVGSIGGGLETHFLLMGA